MKIECFFSKECNSKERLKENLQKAILEERIKVEVSFHEVTGEEARQLKIGGSPTVWIDGQDIEPGALSSGIS
jgi:hypothetical protein